jgi:rhodanese-related sulfurtransferase
MRTLIDVAMIALLALVSLGAGLAMNRFAAQPLPIVYQNPEQRFDKELTTLVTAAPFAVTPAATVGLPQFRAAVEGKTALILDARPADFYGRGHVPGALNLSRDDFAHDYRRLASVLKANTKPVIVYCSGGECHDSKLVANALLSLGSSDVSVYHGGWDEWSASSLPVEAGSSS